MPLIASVSGSTARVLTALFDAEAFTQDGMIDLENIQIFSNCVMGFFIRAGHHSFLEVAETYNRAIDFVVLEHADTLRDALDADVPEQYLPYFRYGNYRSFIHPRFDSMDEKIMREDDPIIPSYFFKHHDDEGSVETVARSLVATHHVTLF